MKVLNIIAGFLLFIILFASCDTRTYEEIADPIAVIQTVNYNDNVKSIIESNCLSCHGTVGSASYYPLNNYNETKNAIDNIINRIERPIGDPLKMPQGSSLSQNNIAIIKQWKVDGLLEQ